MAGPRLALTGHSLEQGRDILLRRFAKTIDEVIRGNDDVRAARCQDAAEQVHTLVRPDAEFETGLPQAAQGLWHGAQVSRQSHLLPSVPGHRNDPPSSRS